MRVLLIAYYFPPMGGAGVQRALKMARYLGEFGVRPVVLCAQDSSYVQDPSLLAELPAGLEIHRVEHRPLLSRLLARRQPPAAPARASHRAAHSAGWLRPHVRDLVLTSYAALSFPDDKRGWAQRAFALACELHAQQAFDLIFSSAPPMSTHWLAARLARQLGCPWVADYRDLWTQNPGYLAPAWRRWMDQRAERRWLRQAVGVVAVTPSWQQQFKRLPGLDVPVAWIPNGYDEQDFSEPVVPRDSDGEFHLVHTGTFYGPRDPGHLLDGLARYLSDPVPGAPRLRLRLVGNLGQRFDAAFDHFEQRFPGVVQRQGYVPHAEALRQMRQADALLLVVGAGQSARQREDARGTLPGKLFEYLRAGAPLLVLADPGGDAAAIAQAHSRCWVADETSPAAIAQALRHMLKAAPPPLAQTASVRGFERRALAGQLADFLRLCQSGALRRAEGQGRE